MNASMVVDGERTVSVGVVSAIAEFLQRMGIASRAELLSAAGLTQAQLDRVETRIPERDAARAFEVALELSGDEALGMTWGERLTVDSFAPLSYLVAHASSLRTGLRALAQFQSLLTDRPGFAIDEDAERVTVRCLLPSEFPERLQRFTAELSLCGFVHIVRAFHPRWEPERVSFEYAAPSYRAEYARFFGHAERFEQPFTGFSFDARLMDAPSLHKDEGMHAAIRELVEQRLTRAANAAPYALRVRQYLVEHGYAADSDMESVARGLGISVRSLRRRLSDEGKSYAEIESEAFAIVVRRMLVDRSLTIQQTAYELGFTSTTSFHRAFKRAMGMTPMAFLDAQHASR